MPRGSVQITKRQWAAEGGLRNFRLWRRQAGRGWLYFKNVD